MHTDACTQAQSHEAPIINQIVKNKQKEGAKTQKIIKINKNQIA